MGHDLTHHEIEELLGAYALDAVEPQETLEIEEHLRGCPRCRTEVGQHREMAALLAHAGQAAAGPASPPAWRRPNRARRPPRS